MTINWLSLDTTWPTRPLTILALKQAISTSVALSSTSRKLSHWLWLERQPTSSSTSQPVRTRMVVLGDDNNTNFPGLGLGLGNTSAIDAPTFEYTSFTNPTNSLVVNLGNGGDTLRLQSMDAAFAPAGATPFTINGGGAADTFNVAANNFPVRINAGVGNDIFNIGLGTLDNITGQLLLDGGTHTT